MTFTIFNAFDEYDRKAPLDYEMIQHILHMCKKILQRVVYVSYDDDKCVNHIEKHTVTMLI